MLSAGPAASDDAEGSSDPFLIPMRWWGIIAFP
jgi:hypothetical protein